MATGGYDDGRIMADPSASKRESGPLRPDHLDPLAAAVFVPSLASLS
jgi:hypothetical protein